MPPRRNALQMLLGVGVVAYAGAAAGPAIRFVLAADGGGDRGERFLRVTRLDALVDGAPKRVDVIGDRVDAFTLQRDEKLGAVWLTRRGDVVTALSATCPHLGCVVGWSAESTQYTCPCHSARFGADGSHQKGPAPRGMDALATRVADGWVEVDFRRFRTGTSERVEL